MPGDIESTVALRVEVLGPLRLVIDGAPVEVPGPKRRAVLALLAMAGGRAVPADQLLDALWPSDPPDSARAALHSQVSRLRSHLGPAAPRLEGLTGAYRLVLEPHEIDAAVARDLLGEARELAEREPGAACARLREAQALWRGPALADLAGILPIAAWSVALGELRVEIDDLLVECAVVAGDAPAVVSDASRAVADDPLRESAVLALMRALAATGRSADALRAAHDYRRRLTDETGLDPSAALSDLERTIAGGGYAAGRDAGSSRGGAIPVPVTPLVGRDSEVAALERLLAGERLVTVVGPGGVGKTRLVFEVAGRHDDVRLLALAPVTDADAIPHALAGALDLDMARGNVLSACVALLAAGPQLLVIDNCEHLVDAARETVATLVESCPELTVLATSREPLGLAGERQCRLAPLPLPDPRAGDLARAPAVAVFLDRARRVRPGRAPGGSDELALVADIVRRLDGMPLAIELAAGRLSSFGLTDLHARLDRALDLLGDGRTAADARHRTLRATLEWSYALLPEAEQRLFRHLAVFPDGVDLATAERVASDLGIDDATLALAHLVDASMLDADLEGVARYRMLETLRSFGLDRLFAAGEDVEASERLVRWAVELATWIDASLSTSQEALGNARLRLELPNLRAAWRLAREHASLDDAIELAVALTDVSEFRDLPEVWRWAQELADDPALEAHPRAGAALASAADGAWMLGDLERAEHLARQALERASDDDGRWRALLAMAVVEVSRARYDDALAHALEAAALSPRPAHVSWIAAMAAAYAGELNRAAELNAQDVVVGTTVLAQHEYVAGEIDSIAGRRDDAEGHYRRAIELAGDVGATFVVAIASVGLLSVLVGGGRHEDALHGYRDVIAYWERTGNWIPVWTTLRNLANLLRTLGDEERARFLEVAADHAPEAPAVYDGVWAGLRGTDGARLGAGEEARIRADAVGAGRAEALGVARQAIADHLAASRQT